MGPVGTEGPVKPRRCEHDSHRVHSLQARVVHFFELGPNGLQRLDRLPLPTPSDPRS
jgi:hypothetical protein